jgi:hypothetical protein
LAVGRVCHQMDRRSSPGDSINPKGYFSFIPVHQQ